MKIRFSRNHTQTLTRLPLRREECGRRHDHRRAPSFRIRRVEDHDERGPGGQTFHHEARVVGGRHVGQQLLPTHRPQLQVERLLGAAVVANVAVERERGEGLVGDRAVLQGLRGTCKRGLICLITSY